MASVRKLKKDIDYLFFELISDCFMFTSLHEDPAKQQAHDIIEEAVNLRNDFIARVNHPEREDNPAQLRAYYSSLRRDLLETVDGYFEKLSSLVEK